MGRGVPHRPPHRRQVSQRWRWNFSGGAGQPLGCPMNRSYLNLLMLKSESQSNPSKQKKRIRAAHATLSVLWVMTAFLTLLSSASAQADFTLQAAPFSPDALAPGGTSSSNITVGAINGFSSTVDLTCQVSSPQTTTSTPSRSAEHTSE